MSAVIAAVCKQLLTVDGNTRTQQMDPPFTSWPAFVATSICIIMRVRPEPSSITYNTSPSHPRLSVTMRLCFRIVGSRALLSSPWIYLFSTI